MAFNFGLNLSFDDIQDLEVMLEKKEDVNITKDVGEDRFF
jgi:hypothetical protein